MAGGSHFIWIPVLLTCVFQASDSTHVFPVRENENSFISTGISEVDKILSKLPINTEGFDPSHINVTSVIIRNCTGMNQRLTALQERLQQASHRYNRLDEEAFGLRREARQLKLQLSTCTATTSAIADSYQSHLQIRMDQMLGMLDSDSFLAFKVMALTRDVSNLEEKLKLAENSSGTATKIPELQRQLQEKTAELEAKKQQAGRNFTHGALIFQIISLQNQIWDLQLEASRQGRPGSQHSSDNRIRVAEEQLRRKITQLRDKGGKVDTDFANFLELIAVRSGIVQSKKMISRLIEESKTYADDVRRQWSQRAELLRKKILQLNRDENNKGLTMEIMRLQELRIILAREKQRQELLQEELEKAEYSKAQLIMQIISIMEELREQRPTGQPTNVSQAKKKEDAKAEAEIKNLKRKLQLKTQMCSKFEERYEQVKTDFDLKVAELNRTEDFKAALVWKLIHLYDELKALKEQISLSEDQDLTSELRKQLEEKRRELNSRTAEIESLTSNPKIFAIIELQAELQDQWKKAVNSITSDHGEELQNRLDGLINEINNGDGESIKLMLKIITLQSQVERLETLLSETNNETWPNNLIRRNKLTDELGVKRNELQKYISELKKNNPTNARLILAITDLYENLQKIEKESHDDNATSSLTLTLLQMYLQSKNREYAIIKDKVRELERKLQLNTQECTGLEKRNEQLTAQVEQKIAELNQTKDFKTALVLNIINLQTQLRALRGEISESKDPDTISELTRKLEKMQDELNAKTEEIEILSTNPRIILTVIELQDEIWELQNKDTNGTAGDQIKVLQNRVDSLIGQIDERSHYNTKLTLKILTLQNQVEHLQKLASNCEMLKNNNVTQLRNELTAKKKELEKNVNKLKEKDQANAKLILSITDLQIKLENFEKDKTTENKKADATISNLNNQLKIKEVEHSRDQAMILDLQLKLNQTETQCSDYENKITDLQKNLDDKIKALESKSDSVTSLALQISTLTIQLEQLQTQLKNSVSKSKIEELQKVIDEKNAELEKLTKELKDRSSQPQRFLQIIAIQTEIEKLVTVAENDTDYEKIKALEKKLNFLVDGIRDEENENTKLTFQILTQQDEIARLKKQEQKQKEAQEAKIKDLEDQLEVIRNQIKEKTELLSGSDTRLANLTAQIMQLHMQIEPLEEEISTLKENNAENLAELQRRLNLKERQLEDTESQLQHIDSENFKLVMEIADLRAKLKQVEKRTPKSAEKKIKDLEEQIKAQQTENRKLESTNKDLKQEVKELKSCCTQDNDQCDDLQIQLQQSQKDADRLQQQLDQKDARLNQLEQDLQRQSREQNKLQDDYNNLQAEKNRLQQRVEALQGKLAELDESTIQTPKMTFDPNTAHPRLVLSEDNTEMTTTTFSQNVPDLPSRFDAVLGILGIPGFSSGRHYWEVSVAEKICFHLGMASESSRRKGSINFSPVNGFWSIVLDKQGQYRAIERRRAVIIPVTTRPATLGILLDYNKGQISFYDSGARTHMYTFVGQKFTDKIYPFVNFCVEEGEAPHPIVLISPGSTDWIK